MSSDDAPMGRGVGALIFAVLAAALGVYYLGFGSGWLDRAVGVLCLAFSWDA